MKSLLDLFTLIQLLNTIVKMKAEPNKDPFVTNKILNDILSGKAPTTYEKSNIKAQIQYNTKIRPVGNTTNDPVYIYTAMSLRQLVSIDEKNQIVTTSFYLTLVWFDSRLSWNESLYNNCISITVPASSFWLPDIAILNSASNSNLISYPNNLHAIVSNTGGISLTIGLTSQQTRCKMNVRIYPFDTQSCSIVIGTWFHDINEVVLNVIPVRDLALQYYQNHTIWDIKSLEFNEIYDSSRFIGANWAINYLFKINTTINVKDLEFNITLKRNPLYIMINGVVPCLLLNAIILIAFSLSFQLQVNLCKSINILGLVGLNIKFFLIKFKGMTSFLTFSMNSLRVSADIPVQSEYLPLITLYMLLSMMYTFSGLSW